MVIVVDTSVWVDHFRACDHNLTLLVAQGRVRQHPYVTGELVAGNLSSRERTIQGLRNLPRLEPVTEARFHDFLEAAGLPGKGLGFVDIHLLAAAHEGGARIWTRDRRMREQAERLELACEPSP